MYIYIYIYNIVIIINIVVVVVIIIVSIASIASINIIRADGAPGQSGAPGVIWGFDCNFVSLLLFLSLFYMFISFVCSLIFVLFSSSFLYSKKH